MSWILQPLSRCSDGYFILPCILETERWISYWSGMEVDETTKWEEVSTRKGKDCVIFCLFVVFWPQSAGS